MLTQLSRCFLDAAMMEAIEAAMNELENRTCVRWIRRRDAPSGKGGDYVYIQMTDDTKDSPICAASVGYSPGESYMLLGHWCFEYDRLQYPDDPKKAQAGSVLHEMLHVLGLTHESWRPDRDCYIFIGPSCKKKDFSEFTTEFPYDFHSIMHDRAKAGDIFMYPLARWSRTLDDRWLGRIDGKLSHYDVQKVKALYCGGPWWCDPNKRFCRAIREQQLINPNCSLYSEAPLYFPDTYIRPIAPRTD